MNLGVEPGRGNDNEKRSNPPASPIWSSSEVTFRTPSRPPIDLSEEVIQGNPALLRMIKRMVEKQVQQVVQEVQVNMQSTKDTPAPQNEFSAQTGRKAGNVVEPQCPDTDVRVIRDISKTGDKQKTMRNSFNERNILNVIKSPSDTTIYAPGLRLTPKKDENPILPTVNIIDQISDFVDKIRIETVSGGSKNSPTMAAAGPSAKQHRMMEEVHEAGGGGNGSLNRAQDVAMERVVQAKKYRVVVQKPAGTFPNAPQLLFSGEDDEFFHLTCHIEWSMKVKIERGKFIELEKLLPKGRNMSQRFFEENKMQLVNRDGFSYWVPMERDKIGSFRRWEQAFLNL